MSHETRAVIIVVAFLVAIVLVLMAPRDAFGQEDTCYTISEASEIMEEHRLEVLGVKPFGKGTALYYRERRGVFAAPIVDGCVSPLGFYVPNFMEAPELNV